MDAKAIAKSCSVTLADEALDGDEVGLVEVLVVEPCANAFWAGISDAPALLVFACEQDDKAMAVATAAMAGEKRFMSALTRITAN